MPCINSYIPVAERSPEDVLNEQRDQDLTRIEQELALGVAQVQVDPLTGAAKVMGCSVQPEGMSDLCVLDALQQRNSVEFQLAAAHAGVQNRNFAQQHARAHQQGHKH